jgi:7-cyano-7-deazaguanine synthase in queuosine biosynthesis
VSSVEEVSLPEQGRTAQLKHVDGIPTFNIDKIQDTRAPFENPSVPIAVLPRRNLIVQGWAIDKAGGKTASAVDIAIDGIPYQATYGSARPEIVQFFKNSAYLNSGFSLRYPTGHLSSGPHNLTVRVVLVDGQLYSESPALTLQVP